MKTTRGIPLIRYMDYAREQIASFNAAMGCNQEAGRYYFVGDLIAAFAEAGNEEAVELLEGLDPSASLVREYDAGIDGEVAK